MFFILSVVINAGQHATSTGTEPMEYFSPISYKLSNLSDNLSADSTKLVERQYNYFRTFIIQKDLKANDIFTEDQMQLLL